MPGLFTKWFTVWNSRWECLQVLVVYYLNISHHCILASNFWVTLIMWQYSPNINSNSVNLLKKKDVQRKSTRFCIFNISVHFHISKNVSAAKQLQTFWIHTGKEILIAANMIVKQSSTNFFTFWGAKSISLDICKSEYLTKVSVIEEEAYDDTIQQ